MKDYRVNIDFDSESERAALRSMSIIVAAISNVDAVVTAEKIVKSILTITPAIIYISAMER